MDIDIKAKQIPAEEQKVVLRSLAESVTSQGCKFLEIGSWCGDSTIVLGNVAKKYGGHLFCVDWWKGNIGIDLGEIASKIDVFSYFWNRIRSEGLEDVVIPIRGRSDIASGILREHIFDLIFIDGDHRYEGVLKDIQQYAPLVRRNKGILCGHDCEGRISDYDMSFLELGKDVDYYESVHCGVVLAVGSTFKEYSINHSIWSVQSTGQRRGWGPTNLVFSGIKDKRQTQLYPICYSKNYQIVRYGRLVYAIQYSLSNFDITNEVDRKNSNVIASETLQGIEKLIGERLFFAPVLFESYKGYNLVKHDNYVYALSQDIGQVDLIRIEENELNKHIGNSKCIIENSSDKAKRRVDQLIDHEIVKLIEEGHRGFNIVQYTNKYFAISKTLGPIDFTHLKEQELIEYQRKRMCVIGHSVDEIKYRLDQMLSMKNDLLDREEEIRKLKEDISIRDESIIALQKDISNRDESIRKLNADISIRDESIIALQTELADLKCTIWSRIINKIKIYKY